MADPHKYEPSYDLVNQYDWTSIARNSPMRNEAPAAYVTAYNLEFSQLRSFIDGYLNILGANTKKGAKSADPGLDFYKRLYGTSSDPITRFSFPFFSDNIRSFTSEFSDSFSPISQRGAKMLGGEFIEGIGGAGESLVGGGAALVNSIANIGNTTDNSGDKSLMDKVSRAGIAKTNSVFSKVLGKDVNLGQQTIGAPGSYIETPKFYQYSNTDNGLELSFALSNTLNNDAKNQNHKFITDFTRMNRPYRTGPIGMTFPAIYNIVVPGQRYIMWASLESFNVGLLGMRRRIKTPNGGSRVIPEAYSCQFSFRSLTIEAANFMDEIDKFGSFAGDENSYASLKKAEHDSLEHTKEQLNRAAIGRSQDQARRIEPNYTVPRNTRVQDYPSGVDPNRPGQQNIHGSGPGSVYAQQQDDRTRVQGDVYDNAAVQEVFDRGAMIFGPPSQYSQAARDATDTSMRDAGIDQQGVDKLRADEAEAAATGRRLREDTARNRERFRIPGT